MKIEEVELIRPITVSVNDALIVVDIQNDFLPGGALAVAEGDTIISGVNELGAKFQKDQPIILTQDWHPVDHNSFASAHIEKKPFDPFEAPGIGPVLWPNHCVQGTYGAEFSSSLNTVMAKLIIRKGFRKSIDSYSTFLENDKKTETGLRVYLKGLGVERIFLCGLALDYCVFYSALDAKNFGFDVVVVIDLTKPVKSPEDSVKIALERMTRNNVKFAVSSDIV
ncbi:MAG: bifunctional nicotinamidase/pyrazinamidase [Candidatus Hermodarchaeota archaeon]